MPFLSIIMPVYNAEKYLEPAVQSVLRQTDADLELICVNDCSADGSRALLEKLSADEPRLRVIDAPENLGAGRARNLGLDAAQGTYVGFMDADDLLLPGILAEAAAAARRDDADEVVWGLTEIHTAPDGATEKEIEILPDGGTYEGDALPAAVARLEAKTLFGYQWNSVYRAEILRENGIRFSPAVLYEDFFFNLDFIRHARRLTALPVSGYHYYKRGGGSVTARFVPEYFELSAERIRRMLSYLEETGCAETEHLSMLRNRLLRYTLSAVGRNAKTEAALTRAEQKERFLRIRNDDTVRALVFDRRLKTAPLYLPAELLLKYAPPGLAVLAGKLISRVYH